LSLPTFSEIRLPGPPPVKVFDMSTDLSVLVLPRVALTIGDGYSIQKAANQNARTGFDTAALHGLYEFFENDKHEAITSIGLIWNIGGSGRKSLGNPSFSTWTPTFYFGKGFGDLPDSLPFLRPFAITGTLGLGIPSSSGTQSSPKSRYAAMGPSARVQSDLSARTRQRRWVKGAFRTADTACRVRDVNAVEPRSKRTNHRHHQPRGYLVRSILPGRNRSSDTGQQSHRAQCRSNRPGSLLSG
jgi:hypothetical protein